MIKPFHEISVGQSVTLDRVEGDSAVASRLLDLGLHPGVEIELLNRMPLGGPIVIRVESSFLALREEEARCLRVQL